MFQKNFLIGLALIIPILGGVYFVFQSQNQMLEQKPMITPTRIPLKVTVPNGWVLYQDEAISFYHPKTWHVQVVPNHDPLIVDSLSLEQSFKERDITKTDDTAYRIFVHKNATGLDATSFARNDIATNWKPKSEPTYDTYPGKRTDAILVNNIVAGMGLWGPAVYIASGERAIQFVSEAPMKDNATYFYPVIDTVTFVH